MKQIPSVKLFNSNLRLKLFGGFRLESFMEKMHHFVSMRTNFLERDKLLRGEREQVI